MENQIKRYTSRTAALTYQICKRKRYYSNHYGMHGLSPEAIDLHLETGTAIHRGIQHLLEHCRIEHPDGMFEEQCVNAAVQFAIELFREDLSKASISLKEGEQNFIEFIIAEHECLIEGLIRCFALKALPYILENYEIIEVENDMIYPEFSDVVIWQSKADAEFLTKDYSKGVIICSLKTASEFAENTIRNLMTDMQGNSEWMAVQAKLLRDFEWYSRKVENPFGVGSSSKVIGDAFDDEHKNIIRWIPYFDWCKKNNQLPRVYAVQYFHLITGSWKDYTNSGLRKRQNFLVHPYKYEEQSTLNVFSKQISHQQFDPRDYKWKVGKGKQPKGWNKINIWEDIGIQQWVDILAQGLVQAEDGNPIDELILISDHIFRDNNDGAVLKEWLISTRYQEEGIVRDLEIMEQHAAYAIKTGNWEQYNVALMKLFRKETQQCWDYYGRHCAFTKICHEGANMNDLIDANFYKCRQPHHNPERLYFIEKGYIEK